MKTYEDFHEGSEQVAERVTGYQPGGPDAWNFYARIAMLQTALHAAYRQGVEDAFADIGLGSRLLQSRGLDGRTVAERVS